MLALRLALLCLLLLAPSQPPLRITESVVLLHLPALQQSFAAEVAQRHVDLAQEVVRRPVLVPHLDAQRLPLPRTFRTLRVHRERRAASR